ncbi:MAG: MBL fold metallo-hydrolase [Candidatus Bathyarchaeota archaeon]|nr:MBL fold metallo-hydrolase [Candidatus Bathyarchaeum tardum]WNZ28885.1 MAG: MBL fold metallo-hydrolase [Candidatus Bathyarchaeota archaeon]
MAVKNVQLTVLIENTTNSNNPKLEAKHGLSVYVTVTVDTNKVTVLMDTGASPEKLLSNITELNVNLESVDAVVLSHGHYDHTGGLIQLLENLRKSVPVIGYPTVFEPKLSMMPHLRLIGAPFKCSDVETVGGVPLLASNPVKIAEGITTTGEVPRITDFEKVNGFWTIHQNKFINDVMLDDQSLVIDLENKGLIVITGCAHSGIINTLKYAQKITGNNKIYAVVGGFHLIGASDEKIQKTITEIKNLHPTVVAPCHCTGKNVIKKFSEEFGDRFVSVHTGTVINF